MRMRSCQQNLQNFRPNRHHQMIHHRHFHRHHQNCRLLHMPGSRKSRRFHCRWILNSLQRQNLFSDLIQLRGQCLERRSLSKQNQFALRCVLTASWQDCLLVSNSWMNGYAIVPQSRDYFDGVSHLSAAWQSDRWPSVRPTGEARFLATE